MLVASTNCWLNYHWCQHGLAVAPQVVIDATKSHLRCLGPLTEWVCALKHLVPNWEGPYTHKAGSWSHHLVEDVEDPADGVEDPGDGPEDLTEVGEALMIHSVVIHALMVSWYHRRRPSYPTGNIMLDLDPWRSPSMAKVVEEAHEASRLMKKPLDPHLMA